MKLFLTPEGGTEIKLHDLGDIYISGQTSAFTPDDFPQKETRLLMVRIEFNKDTYIENLSLLQQVKAAVRKQNFKLKWQDEDELDDEGVIVAPGEVLLLQTATLASQDVPEVWGTYQQTINLAFRWETFDIVNVDTHLQSTFQKTGGLSVLTLGSVHTFKEDRKQSRYMELRNIRDRASGVVTMTGEFTTDPAATPRNRRIALAAQLDAMRAQVDSKDGRLTYGPADVRFFDQVVKVDGFNPEINQANFSIKWALTASYTTFPDEAGYAAADFKVDIQEDDESGDLTMTMQGVIAAATEQIALAKLTAVRTAALAANGFTASRQVRSQVEKGQLNTDDTEGASVFMTLTFTELYRKRVSSIMSFTFQVTDAEDTRTGIIRRVYSGTVVASGADEVAAYLAAVDKAQELGDNKHPFRVSNQIVRTDRKVNQAPQDHLKVEFSYEYELKGTRIYIEAQSNSTLETFGDDTETVSGVVIAKDLGAAQDAYQSQIRNAYNGQLIRGERLNNTKRLIEKGEYLNGWQGDGTYDTMVIRFEFEFVVFKPKATGFYSIKYGIEISTDYVKVIKESAVEGQFFASDTFLSAAEAGTAGNKLDVFLDALSLGKKLKLIKRTGKERVGDSIIQTQSIGFSCTFVDRLSSSAQILEAHVSEQIQYSGVRWVTQDVPDSISEVQDCGIAPGRRTVSGTVAAITEAAAKAWIKKQHALPFPSGGGGGAAPAKRFQDPPDISLEWEFLPLEDGTARGGGANFTVVRATFKFTEGLPNYPYVEA